MCINIRQIKHVKSIIKEEKKTSNQTIKFFSTHHEHEQQQHQQKQHGFCDVRCKGTTSTFEDSCAGGPIDVFSGPLCGVPRSRHPDGNSDTLHDILSSPQLPYSKRRIDFFRSF